MKILLIIFFCIQLFLLSSAQNKSLEAGIKFINDFMVEDGYSPGLGGQFVYRITKHCGIETGIFYKIRRKELTYEDSIDNRYMVGVHERLLHIPLYYRFDSRIVNFSAGVSVGFFIGWKQTSGNPPIKLTYYSTSTEFHSRLGISKSIYLSHDFIIEPEAVYYLDFTNENGGLCLNISLRKKIF